MEIRGSKTEKNLWEAFAGESQARNKYTFCSRHGRPTPSQAALPSIPVWS